MQTLFLLFLFVLQVIGFYMIALLYMKISKFNDLEKKQAKLMSEMDDAIGAYLSELKEENDRLIQAINDKQQINEPSETSFENKTDIPQVVSEKTTEIRHNQPSIPISVALQSYKKAPTMKAENAETAAAPDDRTLAIQLYDEGKSVEEIAKRIGKGKTEVELLLKFR